MDIKGKIYGCSQDFETGMAILKFSTSHDKAILAETILNLKGKLLDISFEEHKEKRSLSANAYAWVLMEKTARAIREQNPDIIIFAEDLYNSYINRMCLYEYDEDGTPRWMMIPAERSINLYDGHWQYDRDIYAFVGGEEVATSMYFKLRGSSSFNSKEMYHLIEMICDDARHYGVETMTPSEIERLAKAWKPERKKR